MFSWVQVVVRERQHKGRESRWIHGLDEGWSAEADQGVWIRMDDGVGNGDGLGLSDAESASDGTLRHPDSGIHSQVTIACWEERIAVHRSHPLSRQMAGVPDRHEDQRDIPYRDLHVAGQPIFDKGFH